MALRFSRTLVRFAFYYLISHYHLLPDVCLLGPVLMCVFVVEFVSPAVVRSAMRREKGERYKDRRQAKEERTDRKVARALPEDELAVSKVFA